MQGLIRATTKTVTRVIAAGFLFTALHFVVTSATLPVAYTLAMSDFDEGPTLTGQAGRAMFWFYRCILIQPLDPLSKQEAPLSWGGGYLGILLNSLMWGCAVTLVLLAVKRHRQAPKRNTGGGGGNGDVASAGALRAG